MQQGPFYPQNQQPPPPQQRKPIISGGTIIKIILRLLLGALILFLFFVVLKLLSSALMGVGGFAEEIFRHINNLFRDATHSFRTAKGFGGFVQLILIAAVVGWAIRRIMNFDGPVKSQN